MHHEWLDTNRLVCQDGVLLCAVHAELDNPCLEEHVQILTDTCRFSIERTSEFVLGSLRPVSQFCEQFQSRRRLDFGCRFSGQNQRVVDAAIGEPFREFESFDRISGHTRQYPAAHF
jgi:hypothetical protein